MFVLIKKFSLIRVLILLTFALLLSPAQLQAQGTTFTVNVENDDNDAIPGNGICETANGNNTCTLRAAIQEANALPGADVIFLPTGIFPITLFDQGPGDENDALTGDLDITDDVGIIGAGPTATFVDVGGFYRGFHIYDPNVVVNISQLTIMNGGGGIAGHAGGGIYNAGALTLDTVNIVNGNVSSANGGGIYNSGNLSITNSTIDNNQSNDHGGGISNEGTMVITNSELKANVASDNGGGLHNEGSLTVDTVLFELNQADRGGAISSSQNSQTNVTNSTIKANAAAFDGGGINNNWGEFTLSNSTVQDNIAATGGGIYANQLQLIVNSTISGNAASFGGGGLNLVSTASKTLWYSTIANNTAAEGGGLHWENSAASITLEGVIIADNGGGGDNCGGTTGAFLDSDGYNLDSGTSCNFMSSTDLNNVDPLLGPLADNGGPTLTHALASQSPAIDAGNSPNCPPDDQRYSPRPVDGDDNGSARCDIGAYEYIGFSHFNFMSVMVRP